MSVLLQELLATRGKGKHARGIYSVCSAHPWVIRAAAQQALSDGSPLLIEATCNQVNQNGGYTGLTPSAFREMVIAITGEEGLPPERIILGGDHLGPNPWRDKPAAHAMKLAIEMISAYASAGFSKLHLDASMPCADDEDVLTDTAIAERAAMLCSAAERCSGAEPLLYVIGTEVPIPGGAVESLHDVQVTTREAAERTLDIHKDVFQSRGLASAWPRVVAMVVQPGVEFNHDTVIDYTGATGDLTALLEDRHGLVFEAHSTDYQKPSAYADLVRDGFAIQKVGPALTFAMREAIFALVAMERELLEPARHSRLMEVMEEAMQQDPKDWKGHYHGTREQVRLLRRYSYSDRMRYYWGVPSVQRATDTLIANLQTVNIPETLLSAYMPVQYHAVRDGQLSNSPVPMVLHSTRQALVPYAAACFPTSASASV
jgi:D-tagatose-1,6-bisphosphate aldolase subunit GatZ/KbaZ